MKWFLNFACLLFVGSCAAVPAHADEVPPSTPPASVSSGQVLVDVPNERALALLESVVGDTQSFIKKTAPEVWRIHVKQVEIEALTAWILPLALTLLFGFLTYGCYRIYMKEGSDYDAHQGSGIFGTIFAFLTTLCFMVLLCDGAEAIRKSVNPEYYAIQKILHSTK